MRMRRSGMSTTMAVTGMLATLTLAVPVFAIDIIDDPMQIDERAGQIIQTSNALCWEMHKFHQQQPDYRQSYRAAKEIWSRAGELRDALRAGPVETQVLMRQMTELNEIFTQVEKSLSQWGDGDRSLVSRNGGPGQRTVVTDGAEVDIPFVGGIRVGRPRVVVTDDGPPQFERRRLHPNSHGSKRSLERELAALQVALSYMLEDAGVTDQSNAPAAGNIPQPAVPQSPVPQSTVPGTASGEPQKISPSPTKKPAATAGQSY